MTSWLGAALAERKIGYERASSPLKRPRELALLVFPLVVILYVLLPKFLWENFNGDGAEVFEAARLLLHQPLPFWGESFGEVVSWPGVSDALFLYPASWMLRLFGPLEASVRLPYLLYVLLTYCGLLAVIGYDRDDLPSPTDRALIWSSLLVFSIVVAFSATYGPYFADIASPGTQSTLRVALFLGVVAFFLRGDITWLVTFCGLVFFNSPDAALLLALWLGAVFLCWRPRPSRRIGWLTGAVAGFVLLSIWLPDLLPLLGGPAPGDLHSLASSLERFRHLQYGHLARLAYVVVPCGILPAVALPLWRRQDQVSRALAVVTVGYFAVFYFKAYVALHFFIPAMVLPVALFWRMELGDRIGPNVPDTVRRGAVALACAAALALSWPSDLQLHTHSRDVARHIDDRTDGYRPLDPSTYHRNRIFSRLFNYPGEPQVPDEEYGVSPLVLRYYANLKKPLERPANYILQPRSAPAPSGTRKVAEDYGASLYVRSDSLWEAHREATPPSHTGSELYRIPMGMKLPPRPMRDGPHVVDICLSLRVKLRLDLCG